MRQEDKEPVFDSVKTITGMLEVSAEFALNIHFNQEKIRKALPAGHLDATTLADYLVKKASNICYSPSFEHSIKACMSSDVISFQHNQKCFIMIYPY